MDSVGVDATCFTGIFEEFCKHLEESQTFHDVTKEFVVLKTDLDRMRICLSDKFIGRLDPSNAAVLCAPYPHSSDIPSEHLVNALLARSNTMFLYDRPEASLADIEKALSFGDSSADTRRSLLERKGHIHEKLNNIEASLECYSTAKNICVQTNNKDMVNIYNEIIATLRRKLKKSKEKQQRSSKVKTDLRRKSQTKAEEVGHICEPLKLEVETPNQDIPGASISVGIHVDQNQMKSLVAVKDIAPGDVLIIESPYACGVMPKSPEVPSFCCHCFKRLEFTTPCHYCCDVAYCSDECQELGWASSHGKECKLIRFICLHCAYNCEEILITLRIILRAGPQSLYELFKNSSIDEHATDGDAYYDPMSYRTVYDLHTDESFAMTLFSRSVNAYLLTRLLIEQSSFFSFMDLPCGNETKDSNEEFILFVSSLILRHLSNVGYHSREIYESFYRQLSLPKESDIFPVVLMKCPIGRGIYPVLALAEHSCCYNTYTSFHGTVAVVRSLHSIKKGEQITSNQMLNLDEKADRKQRQQNLLELYNKKCKCEACCENWTRNTGAPGGSITLPGLDSVAVSNLKQKTASYGESRRALYESDMVLRKLFQGPICLCPPTVDGALSYVKAIELYFERPNYVLFAIQDGITILTMVYNMQGNSTDVTELKLGKRHRAVPRSLPNSSRSLLV